MDKKYYIHNSKYSKFLDNAKEEHFSLYTDAVMKYCPTKGKFLDVGCGTGVVVNYLSKQSTDAYGIEISESSLKMASKRQGKYKLVRDEFIPFTDKSFDVVGSYDVLEHVENVDTFLNECKRVLKKEGYLIICSPNFLSITNSYHWRTAGLLRKIQNIHIFIQKYFNYLFGSQVLFDKFDPVVKSKFSPDDDATNLINHLDLFMWAKINKMKIIKSSGSILPDNMFGSLPLFKYFTGGVFLILQK